ncbi:MAG: major capsid protein [Microvirus sp.]|nr:MAG: major capsid protein [Microvirus sp.]
MAKTPFMNKVQTGRVPKSVHDLSHDVKLSCNMGVLVPTMNIDVVPSDKIKIGCESQLRLAPMIAPIMHRVNVYHHYYFVPFRVLWPNFEKFITNTPLVPGGDILPSFPTIDIDSVLPNGSLTDYLGIPPTSRSYSISAMHHAAYQFIYNEYYRSQDLQAEIPWELIDGDNSANADLFQIRNRGWERDLFTSCLPFTQKGPAVTIPLSTVHDVNVKVKPPGDFPTGLHIADAIVPAEQAFVPADDPDVSLSSSLYAETSQLNASPTTINDLRKATRLQVFFEKLARGGSRFFEFIRTMFDTVSPDARLQRPEYIYGTSSPVMVSEVLNTTGTDDAPQGNMSGHGVAITNGADGFYNVQEHGVIIGLMSIMPRTAYQDGIPKKFFKTVDPYQYYIPDFDHLGEQPLLNKEIYAESATPDDTFGYLPNYYEYKFEGNRVAGQFRDSLDFWHMGRKFAAQPLLNADFIESDPTLRIFAVTDPDIHHLWCHVYHTVRAIRPMSKYSTPMLY